MFKSKSKSNVNDYDFEIQLDNMKKDLFYIKKARSENTVEAYYNNSFNFIEIPQRRTFNMNTNNGENDHSIDTQLIKLRKEKKNGQVLLRNRLQNLEIDDSFYLKFKKTNKKETINDENDVELLYMNDDDDDVENTLIDSNEKNNNETESIFFSEDVEKIKLCNENYYMNSMKDESFIEEVVVNINMESLLHHLENGNKNTRCYIKNKININDQIPLVCYTTWHTKNLPPLMENNYNILKDNNKELNFQLYDEDDCKQFINQYFDKNVYHADNNLVPSTYNSDLWRYCLL